MSKILDFVSISKKETKTDVFKPIEKLQKIYEKLEAKWEGYTIHTSNYQYEWQVYVKEKEPILQNQSTIKFIHKIEGEIISDSIKVLSVEEDGFWVLIK